MQMPSSAPDLPVLVAAAILAQVPQQQRLTQCALVCTMWAAAAALATVHVKQNVKSGKAHAVAALAAWLQKHAGQLLSLQLSADRFCGQHMLQLPLHKLTQLQLLKLVRVNLRLPGEDSSSISQAADTTLLCCLQHLRLSHEGEFAKILTLPLRQLSQLQQLELVRLRVRVPYDYEDFTDSQEEEEEETPLLPCLLQLKLRDVELASTYSLMQLTDAPNLTSLVLEGVSVGGVLFSNKPEDADNTWESTPPDWDSVQQAARALPRMLQQLPRLSVLELPGMPFTDAAVQALRGLPQLRRVTIQHTGFPEV